jgi:hypothetical protein
MRLFNEMTLIQGCSPSLVKKVKKKQSEGIVNEMMWCNKFSE